MLLASVIDGGYVWNVYETVGFDEDAIDLSNCSEAVQRLLESADLVIDSIEYAEVHVMAEYEDELEEEADDEDFSDDMGDAIGLEKIITIYDKKTGKLTTSRTIEW